MNIAKNVFALTIVSMMSACGGPPSPDEGRTQLQAQIQAQSNGLIKLVSFDKTNGVEAEENGVKFYAMDYSLEIEFVDNCMWSGGGPFAADGRFSAVRGQPGSTLDLINPMFSGKVKASKGQRQKLSGKILFRKTEQGWRVVRIA